MLEMFFALEQNSWRACPKPSFLPPTLMDIRKQGNPLLFRRGGMTFRSLTPN